MEWIRWILLIALDKIRMWKLIYFSHLFGFFVCCFSLPVVPRGIAGGMVYLLNTESDFPEKLCLWTVLGPRKIGSCLPMLKKKFHLKHCQVKRASRRRHTCTDRGPGNLSRPPFTTQTLPPFHSHTPCEKPSSAQVTSQHTRSRLFLVLAQFAPLKTTPSGVTL